MNDPKEIQLIEQQSGSERTSNVWEMDVNTKSNIEQSWKDNKCSFRCDIIKYITVSIIAFVYLGYQLSEYNDESKNSITRSAVETLSEYTIPYFMFIPWNNVVKVEIDNITLFSKGPGDDGRTYVYPTDNIKPNDIIQVDIAWNDTSNFKYDASITSWQLLEGVGPQMNVMTLVPPYGAKLDFDAYIQLHLRSYAECQYHYWINIGENKTQIHNPGYKAQMLQIQEFQSDMYGIYWTASAVQYLQNVTNNLYRFDITNMEYTFISTKTFAQLSLTEQINEWHNTKDVFYDTKITGSQFDIDMTQPSHLDKYCFEYTNSIMLRMSATGGGVKTVISISRLKDWPDMLSATGGVFSPTLTGLTVLFGFLLTVKGFGCARKTGWSDGDKLKAALYLQELGLLTDQQYQEAQQYKQQNDCR